MVTFEARGAAGKQLLRTERGDGDELVGIQVRRPAHHGKPLSLQSCHSHERSVFATNPTMRTSHHVRAVVKRVSGTGLIGTDGGKGSSWGKAMMRNPPNCGRLRTALTCTLARGRDHVLRIRSARAGRAAAEQHPFQTRARGGSIASLAVALDDDALQKPSALHARRPTPPATRATRPHDLRVTPEIRQLRTEYRNSPLSHSLERGAARGPSIPHAIQSSVPRKIDEVVDDRSSRLRNHFAPPYGWCTRNIARSRNTGTTLKRLESLAKSPELWWLRCRGGYVKKPEVTMAPTFDPPLSVGFVIRRTHEQMLNTLTLLSRRTAHRGTSVAPRCGRGQPTVNDQK